MDDISRWRHHLEVAHRDLEVLVHLWGDAEGIARITLRRVVCLDLYETERLLGLITKRLRKPEQDIPPNYLKGLDEHQKNFSATGYGRLKRKLKKIRDKAVAHRDKEILPQMLRSMLADIDEDQLVQSINAFSRLAIYVMEAPVYRFVGDAGDGRVKVTFPLVFHDAPGGPANDSPGVRRTD
jgi:hypothetical protein